MHKNLFLTWLAFIHTTFTHTLHIRLANTLTSLTTVHFLICHRHPVADSRTILPLEFSWVRVTSTQVHILDRSTEAGDAVWTVATLDDRCHQSSNVLWTIMTRWVLFSALHCSESGGTHVQERNTQLSWICCILCRIQTGFTSYKLPYSNANHGQLPPLSAQSVFVSPLSQPDSSRPHNILKNSTVPFTVFLPKLINVHKPSQPFVLTILYSRHIPHTHTQTRFQLNSLQLLNTNVQIWAIK